MTYGAYLALAVALTVAGGIWTWLAFRRRGLRSGVRALGVTLLVPAAYLTGTLRLLGRVVDAVIDWATRLVFSPSVWIGFVVAAVAALLLFVAGQLPRRERGSTRASRRRAARPAPEAPRPVSSGPARGGDTLADDDDDLADVAAILKKHGIS